MSSSKTSTSKSKTVNSLPDWLTSPYQQATAQASMLSQQPAIGNSTQAVLDRVQTDSATGSDLANTGASLMSRFANGNFGSTASALAGAANGDFLASNPFAQNGGFDRGYMDEIGLSGMASDGGLDTGYIDQSLLNRTAAGDFLTADSNPYIKGVADRGADAAMARINAQFGASGRSNGSGLYAQLFSQGISDAANDVYAANYENERQRQQAAQSSLLGAQQTTRENALTRRLSAQNSMLGSRENALSRQASAYDAERQRQQAAAGGLLNTQLSASSQIPSLISSMIASNQAGLSAGNYEDTAGMEKLRQYTSILSALAAPYGIQDSKSKTVEKTGGLGSALGTIASLGSAIAAPFTGGASLLGAAGGAAGPIMGGGFSSAMSGMASGALPQWLGA